MGEKITLYTIDCPKCKVLERKLNEAAINYETVRDIAIMKSKGYMMSPVLEVGTKSFNFTEAIKWVKEQN